MRHAVILTLIFSLIGGFTLCQNENNIWYFGIGAGLDFSSGAPVPLTNGVTNTHEGCATISDGAGNLLFYTDGMSVWDKNHNQMPNGFGLLGDNSSTQSGTIIKSPINPDEYYIFTIAGFGNPDGCQYSVVDMTANAGNGDVVIKNIQLVGPTVEKITAVDDCNGDYWIITHGLNNNEFYSFHLTSAGLNTTPVVSSVGTVHTNSPIANVAGMLRSSPYGNKIAIASYMGFVELFDFDKNTGLLSNPLQLPGINDAYGVEFSPDQSRLYVATTYSQNLWQYDLSLPTGSIPGSGVLIANGMNRMGTCQIGPDQKIYVAKRFSNFVGVINNPNALGAACNFVDNGVSLAGEESAFGLPNFFLSYEVNFSTYNDGPACEGGTVNLTCDTIVGAIYTWTGPNGFLSPSQTSSVSNIQATDTGWYYMSLDMGGCSFIDSTYVSMVTNSLQAIPSDTALCGGGAVSISVDPAAINIVWNDGSSNHQNTFANAGQYWVEYSDGLCNYSDTIDIVILDSTLLNLGNDTTLCDGETLILSDTDFSSYTWSTGSVLDSIEVSQAGLYWVTSSTICGNIYDSINVAYYPVTNVDLGADTLLCFGDSVDLDVGQVYPSIVWSTGEIGVAITVAEGVYDVQITDANGCESSDTIEVFYPNNIDVIQFTDSSSCVGDSILVSAASGGASYTWSNGGSGSSLYFNAAGTYYVEMELASGCIVEDTFQLQFFPYPNFNLDDSAHICSGDILDLSTGVIHMEHLWSTGDTTGSIMVDNGGEYWVNVTNNGCVTSDTINVEEHTVEAEIPSSIYHCLFDSPFVLEMGGNGLNYVWNSIDTSSSYSFISAGVYSVEVYDDFGCSAVYPIEVVSGCESAIYIPNAFTPNGDGTNDFFGLFGDNLPDYELMIFDRWGQLVIILNNSANTWDGMYRNLPAPDDIYVWKLRYNEGQTLGTGEIIKETYGHVTLLR